MKVAWFGSDGQEPWNERHVCVAVGAGNGERYEALTNVCVGDDRAGPGSPQERTS